MSEHATTGNIPTFQQRHRLGLALESADITTDEIAVEIGKSVTTVRNYLAGRTTPGRATLIAWALRCGVPFEWLEHGIESNGPDDGPADQGRASFPCKTDNVHHLRVA